MLCWRVELEREGLRGRLARGLVRGDRAASKLAVGWQAWPLSLMVCVGFIDTVSLRKGQPLVIWFEPRSLGHPLFHLGAPRFSSHRP